MAENLIIEITITEKSKKLTDVEIRIKQDGKGTAKEKKVAQAIREDFRGISQRNRRFGETGGTDESFMA